ncbi:MAG: leucine-rich repeat domain-containing protein [Chitinispirillales bacterium]|jgi:hypothetical protein|nr:leucine-rich repeat domain-containing protein [Chitinispirillales bacterium]
MKKKALMGLALLAIVGAGAVFAQAPTPEKLAFTAIDGGAAWAASALNTSISGDVVIPASHQGKPVTAIREWLGNRQGAFEGCRNITSVIIPYSVTVIARGAFYNCTNLRSAAIGNGVAFIDYDAFNYCAALTNVAFEGTVRDIYTRTPFPGDLRAKVLAAGGGAGTYTRLSGSNTWTKQGGAPVNTSPAANASLNGIWEEIGNNRRVVTISGSTGALTAIDPSLSDPLAVSAVDKGYWAISSAHWRNLTSTGNLTWSGQWSAPTYNSSKPGVAVGSRWVSDIWALSSDGQTLTVGSSTWTRR